MRDVQIEQAGTGTHMSFIHLWVGLWQCLLLCETPAFPSWPSAGIALMQCPQKRTWKAHRSYLAACFPADEPSLHCLLLQQVCHFKDIFLLQSSFSCGSRGSFPIFYLATLCRELGRGCTSVAKFGGNQHPFPLQGQPINHNLRSRDTWLSCPCCGNKIVDRAGQAAVQIITTTPTVPACDCETDVQGKTHVTLFYSSTQGNTDWTRYNLLLHLYLILSYRKTGSYLLIHFCQSQYVLWSSRFVWTLKNKLATEHLLSQCQCL